MKKRAVYSIIIIMLVLTSCTIGGSFYMLGFSLRPEETMRAKNATRCALSAQTICSAQSTRSTFPQSTRTTPRSQKDCVAMRRSFRWAKSCSS